MDIQIVNATADILPGLTSVKAADDPAVFQADVENFRIIGVDENMAYMLSVRRPRIAPFGFDVWRQILDAGQFLPSLAAILATVQVNRFDTHIDDSLIRGIDGYSADVAIEHPAPTLTGIVGAVEAILGNTEIDNVGSTAEPVYGIDGAGLERNGHTLPGTVLGTPDEQSLLGTGINSN
jgi:hypothetical protein